MLLKQLFPDGILTQTEIHVTDIDDRFLDYIRMLAEQEGLPVRCHHHDLREPFFGEIDNRYDCFFTDPPYTMEGMSLFVSRGISALKHEKGLPVFLSYSHKSPDFMLAMQREFVQMGLMTKEVIPHFNKYEGAEIIANQGQMIILNTTDLTKPSISDSFREAIYTERKSGRCVYTSARLAISRLPSGPPEKYLPSRPFKTGDAPTASRISLNWS
ncbi:bis-aminopropyl spermidine synthase family protein [Paenibacillus larvae]|nr:bis-aminopropyl spermidine synthase family protein [Paenibacillus larvae]